jgi:hypothetical protein
LIKDIKISDPSDGKYDIFLSYRVAADADLVEKMYYFLRKYVSIYLTIYEFI